jgi:hypothetical protein
MEIFCLCGGWIVRPPIYELAGMPVLLRNGFLLDRLTFKLHLRALQESPDHFANAFLHL